MITCAYVVLSGVIVVAVSSIVLSNIHKIHHRVFGFFIDIAIIAMSVLGIIGIYNK